MDKKIARYSYNQLKVLLVFLNSASQAVTIDLLEQKVKIKGKSLGALLSSLSRTRFRNQSLILPVGKAPQTSGLRWLINTKIIDLKTTKKQVHQLLSTF